MLGCYSQETGEVAVAGGNRGTRGSACKLGGRLLVGGPAVSYSYPTWATTSRTWRDWPLGCQTHWSPVEEFLHATTTLLKAYHFFLLFMAAEISICVSLTRPLVILMGLDLMSFLKPFGNVENVTWEEGVRIRIPKLSDEDGFPFEWGGNAPKAG